MKKILLTIAISTILTACGSTQKSITDAVNNEITNQIDKAKQNATVQIKDQLNNAKNDLQDNLTDQFEKGKKHLAKQFDEKKEQAKDYIRNLVLEDGSKLNINKFELKGQTIDLIPDDWNKAGFFTNQDNNSLIKSVSGNKYNETRFGILVPNNTNPIAFAQGNVTPINDMPTKNIIVEYLGDYVSYNQDLKEFDYGNISIDVNFGLKDMTLSSINEHGNKEDFKGVIIGNQFTFDNGRGKGQFYGSQASELSGTLQNEEGVTSFGAKKQ